MSSKISRNLALQVLSSNPTGSPVAVKSKGKKAKKKSKNKVVALPAAMGTFVQSSRPIVSSVSGGDGRVRVRHREYIMDIAGSTAYNVQKLSVNPGLPGTFPWLSNMARIFESYLFKSLTFHFETMKGSATVGTLMMAPDYDAADASPLTKVALMSYHNAVRSPVWDRISCVCDSADLKKFGTQRYNRSTLLAANLDVKTYDVCSLFIATTGCSDFSTLGELYVSYEVDLITPHLSPSLFTSPELSAEINGGGTILPTAPLGSAPVVSGGLPVAAPTGNSIVFNAIGDYLLEMVGTGVNITGQGIPTFGASPNIATRSLSALTNAASTAGVSTTGVSVSAVPSALNITSYPATSLSGITARLVPYALNLT